MTLATPLSAAPLSFASGVDPASCARGLYIGGEWLWPAGRTPLPVIDPSTEQLLAEVPDASVEDAAAVEAAAQAAGAWRSSTSGS